MKVLTPLDDWMTCRADPAADIPNRAARVNDTD